MQVKFAARLIGRVCLMGAAARIRPEHLHEKLRQIRLALGLSQTEMLKRLGFEDRIAYHRISNYELGTGEPPLPILLAYARLAGVSTDMLIDDEIELPARLKHKR
ncbi:MAG TPA: helix-turn-helix transcriptional regulator [Pyrinomonadaceae bacterium]|nr:helix-turn-helix transcriptional regulator [Pyrinomonadaceae bacterium]